jgi:hypothetical protein
MFKQEDETDRRRREGTNCGERASKKQVWMGPALWGQH